MAVRRYAFGSGLGYRQYTRFFEPFSEDNLRVWSSWTLLQNLCGVALDPYVATPKMERTYFSQYGQTNGFSPLCVRC